MDLYFWSIIFEYTATVFIGLSVLRVHMHLGREKKIDKAVIQDIKSERVHTILGLVMITLGFILKIYSVI